MTESVSLEALRVRRELPPLHSPEDERLFAAERERHFPAVAAERVSGEFFPAGWHADLGGWKGAVKSLVVRATTRTQRFRASEGRTPLIATDRFTNGYFHWVTETLPRLWWLRERLAELELILPEFASRFTYMTESLAFFPTLRTQTIQAKVRWSVKDALLLPATAPTGNYRPELMQGLSAALRSAVGDPAPVRRLYVSRSRAARRRIVNEPELRAVLEPKGFETVHLEGQPFLHQVKLLAQTTHLISNHGAGLTNMLFMSPGSRVTEIRLRGDDHNNCYFSLARALGLDYDYCLADAARPGEGAHTADVVVAPENFA